jgi:hypothetical protein
MAQTNAFKKEEKNSRLEKLIWLDLLSQVNLIIWLKNYNKWEIKKPKITHVIFKISEKSYKTKKKEPNLQINQMSKDKTKNINLKKGKKTYDLIPNTTFAG